MNLIANAVRRFQVRRMPPAPPPVTNTDLLRYEDVAMQMSVTEDAIVQLGRTGRDDEAAAGLDARFKDVQGLFLQHRYHRNEFPAEELEDMLNTDEAEARDLQDEAESALAARAALDSFQDDDDESET